MLSIALVPAVMLTMGLRTMSRSAFSRACSQISKFDFEGQNEDSLSQFLEDAMQHAREARHANAGSLVREASKGSLSTATTATSTSTSASIKSLSEDVANLEDALLKNVGRVRCCCSPQKVTKGGEAGAEEDLEGGEGGGMATATATKTGDLASALMAADDALQNLVAEEQQLELHFGALAVKDASFRASQAQTQFTGIMTWCRSPTGMDVLLHENMLKFLSPAAQDNAKKEKQNGGGSHHHPSSSGNSRTLVGLPQAGRRSLQKGATSCRG